MGKTAFETNDALTKKLWDEQLFRDTKKESYFMKFFGNSAKALVHEKTQLTKSKGDNITFGIRMRLAEAGVVSGQTLEGNEEALTTHDHDISLERYRHAVRDRGELDRQRPAFSIDEESQMALMDWGSEKIDDLCFDAIQASPTRFFSRKSGVLSTDATTPAALVEATDKITPELLSFTKTWCLTGGNRQQTPLRPIRINGKNYFVCLVHPDVMFDLKQDSTFAQARREALERGKDNPIFSGAEAIWDGVVIHEHENINLTNNFGAGGAVAGATCTFMGAQSLVWAWGTRPKVVQKTFDYDEEHGYAWAMTARTNKPVFNSLDYGSVGLYVARTAISDA